MKGLHTIVRGQVVYGRVGPLCLILFRFPRITNADWIEFMESAQAINAGDYPSLSLTHFAGENINSEQRRLSVEFIHDRQVPEFDRIALLTSSRLERSAMNVFNWFQHRVQLKALAPGDYRGALGWLRERGEFDEAEAARGWQEAHRLLGLDAPTEAGPSSKRKGR